MIIHKKSIKKLAVALEKINYLYGSIKRKEGRAEQVELKLMKRYAADLYDLLLEVELKAMAVEKETTAIPRQRQEALVAQEKDRMPSVIDQFIESPAVVDDNTISYRPPVVETPPTIEEEPSPIVEELFTTYESEARTMEIEEVLDFSPELPVVESVVEELEEEVLEEEEEAVFFPEPEPEPEEEESVVVYNEAEEKVEEPEEEEIYVFEETNLKEEAIAADTLDLGLDKDFSDIERTISEIQEQRRFLEEETALQSENLQQAPAVGSVDEVIETSSKTKILNDLLEKDPPIEHIVEEDLAEQQEEMTVEAPEALNDLYKNQQEKPSIADQLGAANYEGKFPISFNQRFAFINQLFDGDADAFNHSMNELSESRGYIEALTYINLNLRHDYKWQDDDPVVKDFLDMIKRKFLG